MKASAIDVTLASRDDYAAIAPMRWRDVMKFRRLSLPYRRRFHMPCL